MSIGVHDNMFDCELGSVRRIATARQLLVVDVNNGKREKKPNTTIYEARKKVLNTFTLTTNLVLCHIVGGGEFYL